MEDPNTVQNSVPTNQRRTTLIAFLVLLLAAVGLTLGMVLPYLLAILMGGILALLAQPAYRWLLRKKFRPHRAALVVTLGVLVLLVGPLTLFATKAIEQGVAIGQKVAAGGGLTFRSVWERANEWGPVSTFLGSADEFEAKASQWIQRAGAGLTTTVLGIAAALPEIILQLALALFACYFLLVDGPRFTRWSADKVPLDRDVRKKVVDSFRNTAISTIWATVAAASAQAVMMLLTYIILGVPAAFLAAGATFIFAWIPMVGSAPVWIIGALYLYTKGAIGKMIVMIILGFLTGIIDNFIRPMVLNGRSKMHPLVSLVAIFGGISMFGILGVFVGPILAAVMISLLQIWPEIGRRFGLFPSGAGDGVLPQT